MTRLSAIPVMTSMNSASAGAMTRFSITILNGTVDTNRRIEEYRFADGSTRLYADIAAILTTGGSGDDMLTDGPEAGNLTGGAGNDVLTGNAGDDILNGGSGDDTLVGNTGNDVYMFALGDGQDTIQDQHPNYVVSSGGYDAVAFGAASHGTCCASACRAAIL